MLKYYSKIIKCIEAALNVFIVLIFNVKYFFCKISYPVKAADIIQVLGNGPSLKNDLVKINAERENSSCLVVNSFAKYDLYKQLKPEYYVIVDPVFFSNSPVERIKKIQSSTMKAIIENTDWQLSLFVPSSAKNSFFVKSVEKENKRIIIKYIKNIPVIGGLDSFNSILYKHNLANPLFQNVLVAALFLSIKMKFKKILLWGADHSWHEDIVLGMDNHVYTPDKHFYDTSETNTSILHCDQHGEPIKVHDEFLFYSRAFKAYHSIQKFALKNGCTIINLSSKTWIDAFKREI